MRESQRRGKRGRAIRAKERPEERPLVDRHPRALLAALTAALLLPFIGKAFTIDDPLFVRIAQQIVRHPFDPYGFDINWYGRPQPMSEVMINPPLTSYVLAVVSRIFGWSERGFHLAFIAFAMLTIVSTWSLARRFCDRPFFAATLTLATPVFMISATNVMSDVAMLSFFVTALALWLDGLDGGRSSRLWLAMTAATVAGLFKYFGFAVVPLMLLHAFLERRQAREWLPPAIVPAAAVAGFEIATRALYGHGFLGFAANYTETAKTHTNALIRALLTLGFSGGCIIAILFATPFLVSKRWMAVPVALIAAVTVIVFATGAQGPLHLAGDPLAVTQFLIFAACGCGLFVLAAVDVWQRRDSLSIVLLAWIGGTAAFVAYINWTVNGRTILPLAPAAAILIARHLRATRAFAIVIVCATLLVGILAAMSDYRFANVQRKAAYRLMERYGSDPHKVWFEGHWGFQYYMMDAGATPVDLDATLHRDDLLIAPSTNVGLLEFRPPHRTIETLSIPMTTPMTVMDVRSHAGFYSDVMGSLPYSFSAAPQEIFTVMRLGTS